MKKLLVSIVFLAISLFVVDRLGGSAMWYVNQHTKDISGPKIRYLADSVKTDVILLGTSRCNFHYVPSILSDSLGMSVYNGGIDASDCIYAHYFVLNQILRHHTPKVICLELMTSDYSVSENAFESTHFFAPYIGRSELADSVFIDAGDYWKFQLSHLYRYNSKAVSNIAGLLVNKQVGNDNGYIPGLCPKSFPRELTRVHTPKTVDDLKLKYLQKFITSCKSHNIILIFVISPSYTIASPDLYDVIKNKAKKNNIPFLDYHTNGTFHDHPELFKDNGHLWDKGARAYTKIFARDLKIKRLIPSINE